MLNKQPIEKRVTAYNGILAVHSMFLTLQGEGPFTGHPAVFIRLAGCNLQCPGCDTIYTGPEVQALDAREIVNRAKELAINTKVHLVVITGGEPFRQHLTDLCRMLVISGFNVQIETNGTLPVSEGLVGYLSRDLHEFPRTYIIVSPKTGSVHSTIARNAMAYKYVIDHGNVDPNDGLPTSVLGHPVKQRVARPPKGVPVYLQPRDHHNKTDNHISQTVAIDNCIQYGYIMQIQTHKVLNLE